MTQAQIARSLVIALVASLQAVITFSVPATAAGWTPTLEVVASANSAPLTNRENTDTYTATIVGDYETFTVWNPAGQIDTEASLSAWYTSGTFDFTPSIVFGEDTLTVVLHFYNNIPATLHLVVPIVNASPVSLDFEFTTSSRSAPVAVDSAVEALVVSIETAATVNKEIVGGKIFIRTENEYETITLSSLNSTADFRTLRTTQIDYAIESPDLVSSNFNYYERVIGVGNETATIVLRAQLGFLPTKYIFSAFTTSGTGRKLVGSLEIYTTRVNSLATPETATILVGGANGDGLGESSEVANIEEFPTGPDTYTVWMSSTGGSILLNTLAGNSVGVMSITSSNPETATARQVGTSNRLLISGVDTGTATLMISFPGMNPATLNIMVNDIELPRIEASNGSVRVDALGSWTGLTATATDNGGLVTLTNSITSTYKLRGDGADVSLESATALLATVGETVTVTYNVLDHAGLSAAPVTAIFTSIAVPAPSTVGTGGGLTYADEEKIRLENEKAAADKLAAEKAAADAAAALKLADEKAAAETAAALKAEAAAEALRAIEAQKIADAEAAIQAKADAKAAANTGKTKSTSKTTKITLDLADKYYGEIAFIELVAKVKGRTKITVLDYFVINNENGTATSIVKKLAKGQRIQVRIGTKIVFRATI